MDRGWDPTATYIRLHTRKVATKKIKIKSLVHNTTCRERRGTAIALTRVTQSTIGTTNACKYSARASIPSRACPSTFLEQDIGILGERSEAKAGASRCFEVGKPLKQWAAIHGHEGQGEARTELGNIVAASSSTRRCGHCWRWWRWCLVIAVGLAAMNGKAHSGEEGKECCELLHHG